MYRQYSKQLMTLLRTFTPDIEQLSIDECFLDFTPIAYQYESPIAGATLISKTVKEQLGFTVNIGIAPNKLLAKMASDFEKPDRIHTLWKEEIPKKLWPLPIEDLYMVGKSSSTRLRSLRDHNDRRTRTYRQRFFNAGIQKPWAAHVGICQRDCSRRSTQHC